MTRSSIVAPVVSRSDRDHLTGVWVGCRSAGELAAERDNCLDTMSDSKLVLRRADLGLYRGAIDDAVRRHHLANSQLPPRVYELTSTPIREALGDLAILLAIVFGAAAAAAFDIFRRRRRRGITEPTNPSVTTEP